MNTATNTGTAGTINLISTLLELGAQYGPKLVSDLALLIHSTPKNAGEDDAAYIARLNQQITANLDQAAKNDASVEG